MDPFDQRLWPYKPRSAITSTIAIILVLLVLLGIAQSYIHWPSKDSEITVLIGILLISLLPILLALVDLIIARGGTIEMGGVKIDFSQMPQIGNAGISIPVNIGLSGQSVMDSSTTEILDALRQATSCDIVIIDLEEGAAWWETRLLVLLAGAVRLNKPEKLVFIGKDGGVERKFLGWGYSRDLFRVLLKVHPLYLRLYHIANAAAKQWELVEPFRPGTPGYPEPPLMPPTIHTGLASMHPWMAFDENTGLPNPLLHEQLFQNELGENIEIQMPDGPEKINIVRLDEVFGSVLHKHAIDENWSKETQINKFFEQELPYVAMTRNGEYVAMVSRLSLLNEIVKSMLTKH